MVLLDNVIQQQKKEFYPNESDANFFEYFVAKEILKNEDLSFEEIEACLTGGSRDGGIDGIFLFVNGRLVLDEEEIPIPKGSVFKLYVMQASTTEGFKEDALIKFESSSSDLFDLSKDLNELQNLFSQNFLEKISLFQSLYKTHASKFPKLEIKYYYATRSIETPHRTVLARANSLKNNIKSKFGIACDISIAFLGATQLWELANESPIKAFKLNINGSSISTTTRDAVCFVDLLEYKEFITNESGDLRRTIFESNVRDYQGTVEVNKKY